MAVAIRFFIAAGVLCLLFSCSRATRSDRPQASASSSRPAVELKVPKVVALDSEVDNSRCHVCHINYADESLAVEHARAGIGCEQCHGESDSHCGDENNITPPDIMYPKEIINRACMTCHLREELAQGDLGAVHKPVLTGMLKQEYCTDCHGKHRLAHRTRRWDRRTGRLILDDKVRVME